MCIASGPGKDMFESTQMIGEMQYLFAMKLMYDTGIPLNGSVAFRHSFVNMANLTVHLKNGTTVQTCPAALGYAFAAGTTDGPGQFDFTQHTNTVRFCLACLTYLSLLRNYGGHLFYSFLCAHYFRVIRFGT